MAKEELKELKGEKEEIREVEDLLLPKDLTTTRTSSLEIHGAGGDEAALFAELVRYVRTLCQC